MALKLASRAGSGQVCVVSSNEQQRAHPNAVLVDGHHRAVAEICITDRDHAFDERREQARAPCRRARRRAYSSTCRMSSGSSSGYSRSSAARSGYVARASSTRRTFLRRRRSRLGRRRCRQVLAWPRACSTCAPLSRELERCQVESETRLATELVAVAGVVSGLRDDLRQDRALREQLHDHERRLRAIEARAE